MESLDNLLNELWQDYAELNPAAQEISRLLALRGEAVVNDHIALRTFDDSRINIDVMAKTFIRFGYEAKDTFKFPEKKLNARYFAHPDLNRPKVFISQLQVSAFSKDFQKIVRKLLEELSEDFYSQWDLCVYGRPWKILYETYEKLRKESEFAAWLAAFGFRANHFTVSVNALKKFETLTALNAFIKDSGYALNTIGGEIKGSPAQFLEQSSTLAENAMVRFGDGNFSIPACYYEFAKRYEKPDGNLFQGFIAESANRIFESTDNRRKSQDRRNRPRRNK